ncbi:hypothetical protein ACOJI1_001216 [Pseudomonas aeruginosa]|uniref:hypothetical protein n=1 Tax=Comamonas sp. CAH-2 TaxID=2605745 RepID=UPI0012AD33C0|nr:hypothetical protein [Comamonas sp. CAH-2]MBG5343092.1 hypothetical protein [Pseudomonas aeruginosa]MBI8362775.1 hypothetical protein [Pseudomonas aeruginosa]
MLQLDVARERKADLMTWPGHRIELLYVVARYNIQHTTYNTCLLTLEGRSVLAAKKNRPELTALLAYNSAAGRPSARTWRRPKGRRQVPRLVDDLGRSWMEFAD